MTVLPPAALFDDQLTTIDLGSATEEFRRDGHVVLRAVASADEVAHVRPAIQGCVERQIAQQRRVDQCEDGAVCRDTEGERDDRGAGEPRTAAKSAECVSEIVHEKRSGRLATSAKGESQVGAHVSALLDISVAQIDDAIAVGGVRFRVGHLDDRRALIVETLEQLHDLLAL